MVYPTDLFEAVLWRRTVRVKCTCRNVGLFHPHGLWWRFYRKGWRYGFHDARQRFYCLRCLTKANSKIRPVEIDTTTDWPDITLPMPDEREWRRMIHVMRG